MSPYTQTPASSAVDMFLLIQQQSYNPLLPCLLQVRVYWFCTNIVGAFKEVYSYIDVQTTSTCWRFDGGASDSNDRHSTFDVLQWPRGTYVCSKWFYKLLMM